MCPRASGAETGGLTMNYGNPNYLPQDPREAETRQMALLLHLSHFAGWVIPVLGLVAPIVVWQLKKNDLPGLDAHGKNAANWIISELIYGAVCFVLCFVVIGFPLLMLLGLMSAVFPIIAAVKANNGEVWKYPLAISFFN